MNSATSANPTARRFQFFLDREVARSAPLYAALTGHAARDIDQGGLISLVLAAAPERQRIPNLFFASVQRVLFDHPESPLARYYPSVGGDRSPDAYLPATFQEFLGGHRERRHCARRTGRVRRTARHAGGRSAARQRGSGRDDRVG